MLPACFLIYEMGLLWECPALEAMAKRTRHIVCGAGFAKVLLSFLLASVTECLLPVVWQELS